MDPLSPAVFHILLALSQGQRHGYGILKDVLEHTNGAVRLGPGTLYGTIQRLMALDWVEESDGPANPPVPNAERRRYYRLTRAGRRALTAEVDRLDMLVRAARAHQIVPRSSSR